MIFAGSASSSLSEVEVGSNRARPPGDAMQHDHVPGEHPFRPLLSLVSGIGTNRRC